jgi:hypothetical protein
MKKGFWISIGLLAAVGAYGNIGGYCAAVDAEGTNAYLGAGQVLLRIDVSVRGRATFLAELKTCWWMEPTSTPPAAKRGCIA